MFGSWPEILWRDSCRPRAVHVLNNFDAAQLEIHCNEGRILLEAIVRQVVFFRRSRRASYADFIVQTRQ